ncbi:MAG: hypothetical protein LBT62_06930, partial [Deltaproteobacteria bacterium]|nr:hypothetical protein [Deltaproteobacteria bacterium]
MNFRSPLRPGNLHRYRKVLEAELSRYLPNYQFRLLDAPDKDDDLSSPLSFRDQILGYVSLRLKPGHERASKEVLNLFPEFILAALEKIALKKALTTDSETGLNNRDFFYFKLKKLLAPMTSGPKALKLWEGGAAPELVLALFEVGSAKRSAKADVKELSSILKTTPDLISTARLSDRRLGIIFRADASEALSLLNNIRATFLKKYPTTQYYCAYALHPQDLALDPQSPFHDPSVAAEALMEKADCALHFAFGRRTPSPAIGFGDLINSYGQIVQVLQQDRVLINLGMSMGALPGQVFTVQSPSGERKGEATIFETAEAHSLAQTNG